MELCFLGAAREVTGSRYLLNAAGKRILIDCGMEQGADIYENQELPVPASGVDCVVLTHAHIDHSGMLPALYKDGFRGPIYATPATIAAQPYSNAAHSNDGVLYLAHNVRSRSSSRDRPRTKTASVRSTPR